LGWVGLGCDVMCLNVYNNNLLIHYYYTCDWGLGGEARWLISMMGSVVFVFFSYFHGF